MATVATKSRIDHKEALRTGPGTLGGRYLRGFWQPVRLSSDIKPGRALQVRVMSQDYTLYRGQSGQAYLLDNRCAHRGTQLSVGTVEGESIRCMYHGWKYDETGQCVQQPAEPRPFCDRIKVRNYPVREYLGLIFAYLGEGDPPPFTQYERFDERADRVRAMVEIAPFGFFQRMENSHDFSHLPFVHKQCFADVEERTLENVVPRITSEECGWGLRTHRMDPNGQHLLAYFGMPNINYIVMGGGTGREWEGEGEALFWRLPVDDESHLQFIVMWFGGDKHLVPETTDTELVNEQRNQTARDVLAGRLSIDDVIAASPEPETAFLFGVEDDVVMIGQGVIWDREGEHLGGADVAISLIRRFWTRDLQALHDGKPRTEWRHTADMYPEILAKPEGC